MNKIDEIIEKHNIQEQFSQITALLQKIYEKVDSLPDKKPRLWQRYDYDTMLVGFVDVMLSNGEVVLNMPCNQLPRKNYNDDPTNVVAWREAK